MNVNVNLKPYSINNTRFQLKKNSGNLLYVDAKDVLCCEDKAFLEKKWIEPGDICQPTEKDRQRGFQIYQRDEPGDVRLGAKPHQSELIDCLSSCWLRGYHGMDFFVLHPLRDFKQLSLTLSSFTTSSGKLLQSDAVEICQIEIWPQKTQWFSTDFIYAPELIHNHHKCSLKEGVPQQFALRWTLPRTVQPGDYNGHILCNENKMLSVQLHIPNYD